VSVKAHVHNSILNERASVIAHVDNSKSVQMQQPCIESYGLTVALQASTYRRDKLVEYVSINYPHVRFDWNSLEQLRQSNFKIEGIDEHGDDRYIETDPELEVHYYRWFRTMDFEEAYVNLHPNLDTCQCPTCA